MTSNDPLTAAVVARADDVQQTLDRLRAAFERGQQPAMLGARVLLLLDTTATDVMRLLDVAEGIATKGMV